MNPGERDRRLVLTCRTIVLKINDWTPTPFSRADEEWIAESVEELLQQKFDLEVELIEVTMP